ncbi:signal peptidase I [Streptomyces sp. Isolate_219]|uniref:signal peptidase I n=1 Tax=Streptomyces sp. Isolate_219 TaxID=2950110 RepID=UPI0021C81A41|nr:signal peptidase I [Streptomyces sp. Isolate_219]MCR8574290.1 signal peptidase I [Streptomyces sp. Isolate_219]
MAVGARSGTEEPEEPAGRGETAGAATSSVHQSPAQSGTQSQRSAPADVSDTSDTLDRSAGEEVSGGMKKAKKPRAFWKELPILIGIALLLALLIKTFLVQAFSIPSDSMQDTLQRGDRVLVDKLTPWFGSKPERGEVVVFHDPGGWLNETPTPEPNPVQKVLSFIGLMPSAEEKDLIKRVIAVGGDTVECHGTGPVKVNGKPLKEDSYIFPGNTPCGDRAFGPIHVPKGRIWVMGDHRDDSLDSRYHQNLKGNGTVSEDEVVGRAFTIAWPINRWSTLPVPDTFDQPGINKAMGVAPAALGLAGAVPIVLWRRRRLTGARNPR